MSKEIDFKRVKNTPYEQKGKTKNNKTVYQYNLNKQLISTYKSTKEAAKKNNISASSNVSKACRKQGISHGYYWSYEPLK